MLSSRTQERNTPRLGRQSAGQPGREFRFSVAEPRESVVVVVVAVFENSLHQFTHLGVLLFHAFDHFLLGLAHLADDLLHFLIAVVEPLDLVVHALHEVVLALGMGAVALRWCVELACECAGFAFDLCRPFMLTGLAKLVPLTPHGLESLGQDAGCIGCTVVGAAEGIELIVGGPVCHRRCIPSRITGQGTLEACS